MADPSFPIGLAEWQTQKKTVLARIEEHRDALERAETFEQVRGLQGAISELRWILDLAEPKQFAGAAPGSY